MSIRRQCELLELERSTYYYQPATESPENLALMRAAWLIWITTGAVAGLLALVAYVGMAVAVSWSAVGNRRPGWIVGLAFGILLLTLPLWAGCAVLIARALTQ